MREIKFRAWDKKKECMEYDLEIRYYPGGGIGVAKFPEGYTLEEYDLLEFTGLRDKNGKEIWEGDVIAFKNRNMREEDVLGRVRYDELRAGYVTCEDMDENNFGTMLYQQCDTLLLGHQYTFARASQLCDLHIHIRHRSS